MFSPPRIKFAHAGSPYLPRPIQVKRRVKEIHEIRAISSWIKLNVVLILDGGLDNFSEYTYWFSL